MAQFEYPADLRYTAEHEWVRHMEGRVVRIGITAFAQDALGDIVYVSVPEAGSEVTSGESCGEVESTKSVSDIYSPLTGTVTAANSALEGSPELVNSDPYGDGWMFEVELADGTALVAGQTGLGRARSLDRGGREGHRGVPALRLGLLPLVPLGVFPLVPLGLPAAHGPLLTVVSCAHTPVQLTWCHPNPRRQVETDQAGSVLSRTARPDYSTLLR
jgi:glycine cleavage system H protein